MRILLFTGKGGVGKTTTAAATALRLADRGLKTLLVSTDGAHSIADALGQPVADEPTAVADGLQAVQVDTQRRFASSWGQLQRYLIDQLAAGGVDPITAEELVVLPGVDEVLALLAVGEYAADGRWDALVLDCAPTAETLRLLALPEALAWYLKRIFPLHRALAGGLRPLNGLLGRASTLPPDQLVPAVLRLADDLSAVRQLLTDPATTSVRLVLTPEAVVTAEARRALTALALYGYPVDEVVVNRLLPASDGGSDWQRAAVAAQRARLADIHDSFGMVAIRAVGHQPAEPVSPGGLRLIADQLYGRLGTPDQLDPAVLRSVGSLLEVAAIADREFELRARLPLAAVGEVAAARSGDELVITVAGHRRLLTLPSVLRRCRVVGGSVADGQLVVRFVADETLWPAP